MGTETTWSREYVIARRVRGVQFRINEGSAETKGDSFYANIHYFIML